MDKLSPICQVKLQNIIKHYNNCRKYHQDNKCIAIENQRREEERKEIDDQLRKINMVQTSEEYLLLSDEKSKINNQFEAYEEDNDEILDILCDKLEMIENKQLEMIKSTDGIDFEFLEENNMKIDDEFLNKLIRFSHP
jgi:type II secretory pathway component HofQ